MAETESKHVLRSTSLGNVLQSPEELNMLAAQSEYVSFLPGEIIVMQGRRAKGLFIIIEGTALVTAQILGEGGTYIGTLGTGHLFGEISLIDDEPSATTVMASSHLRCLLITPDYFNLLAKFYPKIKYKISKAIAAEVYRRLRQIHKNIINFITNTDMTSRSIFAEVIKSITRPTATTFEEANVPIEEIRNSNLFQDFSQEEFELLISNATALKAPNQCLLIEEQEINPPCYLLLKGAVQSSIVKDNKAAKLAVLGPITFFGSLSLIDESAISIINYTTCERAFLLRFTNSDLSHLQQQNLELWYKIFDWICKSLVSLERSVDKLAIRLNIELYNR